MISKGSTKKNSFSKIILLNKGFQDWTLTNDFKKNQ
jgi:hypothetical protein